MLTDVRIREIGFALFWSRMLEKGITIKPHELRDEINQQVERLNKDNPGLNVSSDEALEFARMLTTRVVELAFRPSNRQLKRDKRRALETKNRQLLSDPAHQGDGDPLQDPTEGHNKYEK